MKLYIVLSLLLSGCLAHGKPYDHNDRHELMNFHEGTYKLTLGTQDQCGEGHFRILHETKYILFDALHGFSINNSMSSVESDIAEEKEQGCKYIGKNDVKIEGNKTELVLTSVFKCKEEIRYSLVKRAKITNRTVVMHVGQTGENPHKYRCVWQRQN
jgi:hypothetical protein